MVRIHVGLDLEHQCRKARLRRLDDALVGRLRAGRRAVFRKTIQQVGDSDTFDRAAEINRRQMAGIECLDLELRQRGAHQIDLLAKLLHPRVGLRQFGGQVHGPRAQIVSAGEGRGLTHRPGHRRGVERQRRGHLIQQRERALRLTVELVDEGDDRDVPQAANLEQFSSSLFDPLGGVDDHDGGIDSGQSAIGVLGKILVARRVEQVEHAARLLERHHGRHDGNAAFPLDAHPVGAGAPPLALGAYVAGELDGATGTQQMLGQRGFAGVGVRYDRESAPAGDFRGLDRRNWGRSWGACRFLWLCGPIPDGRDA